MREFTVALAVNTTAKVLEANNARRGYKIEPLGTETPLVSVAVRSYRTVATSTVAEVQTLTPSTPPASGTFKIKTPYGTTSALAYNATAGTIQTALRAIAGLAAVTVSGTMATAIVVTLTSAPLPFGVMTVVESTLKTAGTAPIATLSAEEISDEGSFSLEFLFRDIGSTSRKVVAGPFAADASSSTIQDALQLLFADPSLTVTGADLKAPLTITFAIKVELIALNVLNNRVRLSVQADEVQSITPDAAPDAGAFTLVYGAQETASLAFDATEEQIEDALQALEGLETVTVVGTLASSIAVTFVGVQAPLALEEGENTLEASATPVVLTFAIETPYIAAGDYPLSAAVTTKGVLPVNVTVPRAALTTPGDSANLNTNVSQGSILTRDEGDKGDVYCRSGTAVTVKVTEL